MGCIWFQVFYSVCQFIGGDNDSNSNTEWSQRYNLYQAVITKVSYNKPFVLRYKLHNSSHSLLVNGVVTASSHALWRVLSNKVIWVLGHCWVDTRHIHTFEGDSVFSKLFALHVHGHAEWLKLCQQKRFSWTGSVKITEADEYDF